MERRSGRREGRRRMSAGERKQADAERKLYARAKGKRLANWICLIAIAGILLGFTLPWRLGTVQLTDPQGAVHELRNPMGWIIAIAPHGYPKEAVRPKLSAKAKALIAVPALAVIFALLILLDMAAPLGRPVSIICVVYSLAALVYLIAEALAFGGRRADLSSYAGLGFIVVFLFLMLLFLGALFRWPNSSCLAARQFAALKRVAAGELTVEVVLAMGEARAAEEEEDAPLDEDDAGEDDWGPGGPEA